VYTRDRTLDEAIQVRDRNLVMVSPGYHPVAASPATTLINACDGRPNAEMARYDRPGPQVTGRLKPPCPDNPRSDPAFRAIQQRRWRTVTFGDTQRHSAKFGSLLLKGAQRAVNRKVRSSSLRPGANSEFEGVAYYFTIAPGYSNRRASRHQITAGPEASLLDSRFKSLFATIPPYTCMRCKTARLSL
jgi:KduI/IolB family